jgi:peptidylprolyl isomerase
MPKTASKRAQARRVARVSRAHQTVLDRPVARRVPAAKRRRRPGGFVGFVQSYPWASTLFALLLIGGFWGLLYSNHLGPYAPIKPKAAVHTPCDLKTHRCDKPPMTIDTTKLYVATIKTTQGDIVIDLDAKDAPIAVNNFVYLAQQHFYDGLTFHRVLHKGQPSDTTTGQPSDLDIIQGGDPQGNGQGGPGYTFKDEPVVGDYVAGAVAMANSGPDTNGSQFFICTGDDSKLPKSYTLFGHVVSGLDVAQKIVKGDKMLSVTIAVQTPSTPAPSTPAPSTPTAAVPTATVKK